MTPLEAALSYAARGWRVFPLKPGTKEPATLHGCLDATTDETTICMWWPHSDPPYGVGIATGRESNLWVVDVDDMDAYFELTKQRDIEQPLIVHTPRGGMHLYYAWPGADLRNTANRIADGIDTRGEGGYVVAPGTPGYEWDTEVAYEWEPPGVAPGWLVREAQPPEREAPQPPRPVEPLEDAPPGVWLNATFDWQKALTEQGARFAGVSGAHTTWTRPGKDSGVSATLGYLTTGDGVPRLKVFTPNWPGLEAEQTYDPLGYVAATRFDGSIQRAVDWAGEQRKKAEGDRIEEAWQRLLRQGATNTNRISSSLVDAPPIVEPASRLNLINWPELWAGEEPEQDWLVEPILPRGRLVAIAAAAKTGKSLFVADIMASLTTASPLLGRPNPHDRPVSVLYLDMEMAPADVRERLDEMGYRDHSFNNAFHYASLPSIGTLDNETDARAVIADVIAMGAEVVVVDTRQRAIGGEENDANPTRNAARLFFTPLKQLGITVVRIDHLGKDTAQGVRGTSALRDDVDVEWKMTKSDDGIILNHGGVSRLAWVPQKVEITRQEDPVLRHVLAEGGSFAVPAGTKDVMEEMDRLDVPLDVTRRALRAQWPQITGDNKVISAALKARKQQRPTNGAALIERHATARSVLSMFQPQQEEAL